MFFFIHARQGVRFDPIDGISTRQFYDDENHEFVIINFYGFPWLVSNYDLRAENRRIVFGGHGVFDENEHLMDRVASLVLDDNFELEIAWLQDGIAHQ